MKKKILLTGASGFIGKSFLQAYSKKYDIFFLKKNTFKSEKNLEELLKLSKPDIIIHAGANTNISNSFDNPYQLFKYNLFSTLNIAELCRLKKINRIIYLNSYGYGKPQYFPIDEKHPLSFHTPYTSSKYSSEKLLFDYAKGFSLNIISLRIFNIYGLNQGDRFLIPSLINQALNNKEIEVNDIRPRRDFLYIKDLLNLLIKIIEKPITEGIYNVGFGKSTSIVDIVKYLEKILKKSLRIKNRNKFRENEILDCYAEIEKLKMDFSWNPEFDIEKGLKDYLSLLKKF